MIKKDLPTLLKQRAEHNLDDKFLVDRIEEMMLEVIRDDDTKRANSNDVLSMINAIRNTLREEQRQRLSVLLGKGEK